MPSKPHHAQPYGLIPPLLRRLREEAKLTQRDLALQLDRQQSWVHKSEAGTRRVDLAEFCAWCVACNIKPETALRRYLRT
jgi:transcriptional regulator with XRE-family HTH domain